MAVIRQTARILLVATGVVTCSAWHSVERPGRAQGPALILIEVVPHLRQEPDFCGEACAAMYLQERDSLRSNYEDFRRNRARDRTGCETLCDTLGGRDMTKFQVLWEKRILSQVYE